MVEMIDMKYFNTYYFCQIANETMGKFEFLSTNTEFFENYFATDSIEDFPKISILRDYSENLVNRIFFEQANFMDNYNRIDTFNPFTWIDEAIKEYKQIDVKSHNRFIIDETSYLESYNNYLNYLEVYDIDDVFEAIAKEVEMLLFQNRNFLLRFNQFISTFFQDSPRSRVNIPEWVKRAVFYRDKGWCVFCASDLSGLCRIPENYEKQFDHIVPLAEGGLNDVCNLQLTCENCNRKKSDNSCTNTIYQSAY